MKNKIRRLLYTGIASLLPFLPSRADEISIKGILYDVRNDTVVMLTQDSGQRRETLVTDEALIEEAVTAQHILDEIKAAQANRTASDLYSLLTEGQELEMSADAAVTTALTAPAKILATAVSGGIVGIQEVIKAFTDLREPSEENARKVAHAFYSTARDFFEQNRTLEENVRKGAILTAEECKAYQSRVEFINTYMGAALELFEAVKRKEPLGSLWLAPFTAGLKESDLEIILGQGASLDEEFTNAVKVRRSRVETRKAAEERLIDAKIAFVVGHAYSESGALEMAIQALTRATELDPGNAEYWNSLGHVLWTQKGRRIEAIDLFERALSISPNFWKPLINLSSLYKEEKNWAEALSYAERAQPFIEDLGLASKNKIFIDHTKVYLARKGKG